MTDQQIKDKGSPRPCFWYFYARLLKFGVINVGLGWTCSSYLYIFERVSLMLLRISSGLGYNSAHDEQIY